METGAKKSPLFSLFFYSGILYFLIFLVTPDLVIGALVEPNFYYYSSGSKIALPLSKEMVAVRFKQGITLEQQEAIVDSEEDLATFSERKELLIFELTLLPVRQGVTEENIIQTISSLNCKSEVGFANPVFDFPDANLTLTDEFIVKF